MSAANDILIRDVGDADMPAIQAIYAHHVIHGLASWEETPPDTAEMCVRRDVLIHAGYPYRVAARAGRILGYTYAGAYRPRPAYRNTVENSVYVAEDARGQGIGPLLLGDIIDQCARREFRCMVAIIGDSQNTPSIKLHERAGFEIVGTIPGCGYKGGRWLNQVIMHKPLGPGATRPPNVQP